MTIKEFEDIRKSKDIPEDYNITITTFGDCDKEDVVAVEVDYEEKLVNIIAK